MLPLLAANVAAAGATAVARVPAVSRLARSVRPRVTGCYVRPSERVPPPLHRFAACRRSVPFQYRLPCQLRALPRPSH